MVLGLAEFLKNYNDARFLYYYSKLPEMLHEMSAEDIVTHINRYGVASTWRQKHVIIDYFKWLQSQYNIDTTQKIVQIEQQLNVSPPNYIGFFSLDDLIDGIDEALMTLEISDNPKAHADYDGLYAVFYLEWFGIQTKSIPSIKLSDVTDLGRKIYVPAENRTVEITDEAVANYLWEYKNKTGHIRYGCYIKEPYTQDTFYRNTNRMGAPITIKTLYNIRHNFQNGVQDNRFEKNRIYESGRFYTMLMMQEKSEYDFSPRNKDNVEIIRNVFNNAELSEQQIYSLLRKYTKYKKHYLELL